MSNLKLAHLAALASMAGINTGIGSPPAAEPSQFYKDLQQAKKERKAAKRERKRQKLLALEVKHENK